MHEVTLITTIALSLALAFAFGFAAQKLRMPPLVGYLIAGVVIGHFMSGDVTDTQLAGQLAEIGIMLMMFGVGLHFSIADLMAVRRLAVPGAIGQIIVATVLVWSIAHWGWGWKPGAALILGLSVAVASTVVLLRALEARNDLASANGRVAVGWLIVEDLAMVLALVLLPALVEVLGGHTGGAAQHAAEQAAQHAAGNGGLAMSLLTTLVKVAAFVAIALFVGPKVLPWLLREVARTGSRELFNLAVLSIALGIAYGAAAAFDVSFALGAFFAGVVLNESELSHKAATNSLPLQDAFGVLFFVSVGMLFNPDILVQQPGMVASVAALVLFGKPLVALGTVLLLGYPISTAFMVAAALAQIGEFSFILGGLGLSYGLLDHTGFNLMLAAALISIVFNPIAFAGATALTTWLNRQPALKTFFEDRPQPALLKIQADLKAAEEAARERAAHNKTFTPEELAAMFPLFANLTPEQREVLVLHFHPHTSLPGEKVIRAGEEADALYLISKGEVAITQNGKRINVEGPGEYFGEMALLSGGRRSADVTALDYCHFAKLSNRDFHRFLKRYPEIREQVAAIADERARHSEEQAEQALPEPAA